MSNVKGYSLKYNIYIHFVPFDKIVEVQMIISNFDGSTNYIVYIFVNSVLIGK